MKSTMFTTDTSIHSSLSTSPLPEVRSKVDIYTGLSLLTQQKLLYYDVFLLSEHVDVNVTPDKRQVMLHQEKAMLALVKVGTCGIVYIMYTPTVQWLL